MTKYKFTPQATTDLFDIWSFIAGDNPAAAILSPARYLKR